MRISVKVAGQSAIFLAGNLFTLVVGFVLQIYLARKLGAEGLGVFGLLESGVGVFTAILGLGIAPTAMRFIPEHLKKKEYEKVYYLVRKGFYILAILGGAGLCIIFVATPLIATLWPELEEYQHEMMTASLLIPLGLLLFYCSQVLRGFLDIRHIVFGSSFLQLTVKALLAVLFIWMGYSVLGYIWAVVLATSSALAWMLFGIGQHLKRIPQVTDKISTIQPEWNGYARIMIGHSLLNFWSAPLDRFLLGYFVGAGAVGVLMIGKMLYALPGVFLQMFLSIAAPMMASAHAGEDREEVQQIYHLCTDWLVRISLPLVIFLMVFAGSVLNYFGEIFFTQGYLLLEILLVAQLFNLVCGPVGNVLNMCGLEKQMFNISIVSTLAGSAILILAVYFWGIPGAGVSVLITVVYMNLAALHIARNRLGFTWWDVRYIKWLLPLVAMLATALLLHGYVSEPHQLIVSLIVLYAVFHGSYWLLHGFSDEDSDIYLVIRRKFPGYSSTSE